MSKDNAAFDILISAKEPQPRESPVIIKLTDDLDITLPLMFEI